MAVDLKEECDRLQGLVGQRGSPAAREQLVAGLHSKWEGVQLVAARALLEWGDPASLASVKELLVGVAGKDRRNSATRVLAHALAPHLGEDDMDWVLDLYFGSSLRWNRRWLARLFDQLPEQATVEAIGRRKLVDNVDPRDEKLALLELRASAAPRR
jgi:hypothetical protein